MATSQAARIDRERGEEGAAGAGGERPASRPTRGRPPRRRAGRPARRSARPGRGPGRRSRRSRRRAPAWSQPLTQARPAAGHASRADRLSATSGERRPGQPEQQEPGEERSIEAPGAAAGPAPRPRPRWRRTGWSAIDQPMAVASGGRTRPAEKLEPGRPMTMMARPINNSGGHPPARKARDGPESRRPSRRPGPAAGRSPPGSPRRGSCRAPAPAERSMTARQPNQQTPTQMAAR